MTKTAICVLLAVFIFSCGIVSAQDSADYIQKAVSLMNEGKFKDAYDLLNKNYQAHKDDLQINFMLGQCAFELQKFEEAKKEFQAVLATNPPPVVGENIKRFIEMIEAQKNWYARVSVGYLYDSNVNAGPTAKSVLMFGVPFELSKDAREKSDNGEMVSASFGYLSPMTKTFAWQSEFSISHTGYFRYSEFNSEIYSASTGPSLRNSKIAFSLPFLFDYTEIGSDRYSYAFGISPQIQYALSQNIILSASWTGQSKYYYTSKDRTGTAWSGNASLRFNLSQSMFIQPGYRHTEENTQKAYLDNKSDAVSLGFYTGLPKGFSLFVQPSMSWNKYKEKEAAYDHARDDLQYIVNANLSKDLGKGFAAAIGYTYTRNDSNLAIYDYKREQVTFQVSKAF